MRRLLLGCLVVLSVTGGICPLAYAQTSLPDSQLARIRANCSATKASLNRIHATDALMRVNQGQIYELLSTKLMARFNGRIALNQLDSTELVGITADYTRELATFRRSYQTYEQQLSVAINTDCTTKPQAFYDAVASARTKRVDVANEVGKLNNYLSQYRKGVDTFSQSYQTALQEVQNAQ